MRFYNFVSDFAWILVCLGSRFILRQTRKKKANLDGLHKDKESSLLIDSLSDDKNIYLSILKESADENSKAVKLMEFFYGVVENIVEKEKMMVTSIFSFSHNVFKEYFLRVVKSLDCVVKSYFPAEQEIIPVPITESFEGVNFNTAQKIVSLFEIVRKHSLKNEENGWYQHFSFLFPKYFLQCLFFPYGSFECVNISYWIKFKVPNLDWYLII